MRAAKVQQKKTKKKKNNNKKNKNKTKTKHKKQTNKKQKQQQQQQKKKQQQQKNKNKNKHDFYHIFFSLKMFSFPFQVAKRTENRFQISMLVQFVQLPEYFDVQLVYLRAE